MKITAHLVLTPTYDYSGRRITGAHVTAVRQNAPMVLRQGARSVRVVMEVVDPETFFYGPVTDLGFIVDEHPNVIPGAVTADEPVPDGEEDEEQGA